MLKNAKTEYFNEHEEIATYLALEEVPRAQRGSSKSTARRGVRRGSTRGPAAGDGLDSQLTNST